MSSSSKKPNILVIMTDTQRCDTLAYMGNPQAVSPNLDRLAKEGVYFEQAHTSSPVCMPARCSFLTGVHTPIHGCIENGCQRNEQLTVLPDLLKQQGYTNIMVGKTHFGPIPQSFDIQQVTAEKQRPGDDAYTEHLRRHGYDRAIHHKHPTPITFANHWDHFLALWGIKRGSHRAEPGLYAIDSPTADSPVFVTANYTLSFDALRSALAGIDGYIMVLDTRGQRLQVHL